MLDMKKLLTKMLVAVQALTYTATDTAYGNYCKVRRSVTYLL